MKTKVRVIFIFVDGLGLGSDDPAVNPVHSGACPCLEAFLRDHAVPVDACLGVPGLPQSATGQAALLTGLNAAQRIGRHVEGFPGPDLKELIRENNIFLKLRKAGCTCTFANGYFVDDVASVRAARRQSVTTVAALSGLGSVRDSRALEKNEAVYQDVTREVLVERGYRGPLVTPREAAQHLLHIAEAHDFTLFEYFQTDRAGHRGAEDVVKKILSVLDEFLKVLLDAAAQREMTVVLTSDHGNIEDRRVASHTSNPVPCAVMGPGAEEILAHVCSITDLTPAIVELLQHEP